MNPAAGNGNGMKVWHQIEPILIQRNQPYRAAYTEGERDAYRFVLDFLADDRTTTIVAVGGDGTLHEVANGICQAQSDIPLGYIPAGSGNDFARGHGIPMQPEKALELLLGPHTTILSDRLRIGERIAMNSIGAGFDARVARVTNTASYKKWFNTLRLGKLAYVITLARVLFSYKPGRTTLTVDGQSYHYDHVWLIAVVNIPYIGGGMAICPDASPTDGIANVCVVSNIGKLKLLLLFPRVYKGTHTNMKETHFHSGRQMMITADQPLDVHMDGEAAGSTPISLTVQSAAVRVIVPQSRGEL